MFGIDIYLNIPTDKGVGTRDVALILVLIPPALPSPTVVWPGCCVVIVTGLYTCCAELPVVIEEGCETIDFPAAPNDV